MDDKSSDSFIFGLHNQFLMNTHHVVIEDQFLGTECFEHSPSIRQLVKEEPKSPQHFYIKPSINQFVKDKPNYNQLTKEKPRSTEHADDKPSIDRLFEDESSYNQFVEDKPRSTQHANDKPNINQLVEDESKSTQHFDDKPSNNQLVEDKSRNTQHADDKPTVINQLAEEKSRSTQHFDDKPKSTQLVDDRPNNNQHFVGSHTEIKPKRQPAKSNTSAIKADFSNRRSQTASVKWNQEDLGFVFEHSRNLQRNSFYAESQTRIPQAWDSTFQERSGVMLGNTPWNNQQSLPMPHNYRSSQPASSVPYNYNDNLYQTSDRYNHQNFIQMGPLNQQFSHNQHLHTFQQSLPNMTNYPGHEQRKRHHPFEVSASSPPKFLRNSLERTKFPSNQDCTAIGSSYCPRSIVPYQNTQYPNKNSLPPFPNDFVQMRQTLYNSLPTDTFPRFTKHPLPDCQRPHNIPQWNVMDRYHNCYMPPIAYPQQQPVRFNNVKHDFNKHFSQRLTRPVQNEWHKDQCRAYDNHKSQWNDHQKWSSCSVKDNGKRAYQTENTKSSISLKEKQTSHSLKPAVETSMVENLRLFIKKLKMFPVKENSIQTIENCITASHLPIKTVFIVKTLPRHTQAIISAALYINDVFIASSNSDGKKMVKHKVYDTALCLLKTKSIESFMAQSDPRQKCTKCEVRPDMENDLREKLLKLQEHIKRSKYPENQPVMIFDMAFQESQCQLNLSHELEQTRTEQSMHVYTRTRILIEGKLVAHAVAQSKKESKIRAFQKAIGLFTSSDIDTIVKEYFVNEKTDEEFIDDIQELIKQEDDKQKVSKQPSAVRKLEQAECLNRLIQDLKLPAKDGVSIVMKIDKNCVQMKIKLCAVYKIIHSPGQQVFINCDLYILDHLLAQGKASTRKMAQADAYSKGGDILKKCAGADVLNTLPKFSEEELMKPDVLEIVYKGYSKVCESNRCRLNRLKQLPVEQRTISQLVIIEHKEWAEDRKKHSHCILNQSVTQCGCLLEWTTEPENGCFRCKMKIQGEEISSVLAKQRRTALNLASSVALFNLYETQPVVQGFKLDYSKIWITRDALVKYSESHLEDCQTTQNELINGNEEVDRNISRAMKQMLDQFFSSPTLEDFVSAPDWKLEEKKLLRNLANAQGLRVVTDVYCEEKLTIINRKYDLSEMVMILENKTNKYQGRYRLLPKEEKPSYNDIAGEIAANESVVKEYQTLKGVSDQHKPVLETVDVDEDAIFNNCIECTNVSMNSEDYDVFVTADSSFFDIGDVKDRFKVDNITQPLELLLPTRTSTPTKTAPDFATCYVGKPEISKSSPPIFDKSHRTKHAKCMSPSVIESSLINTTCLSTTPAASMFTSNKEFYLSNALPLNMSSEFQTKEPLGRSQTDFHGHSLLDFGRVSSSSRNVNPAQAKRSSVSEFQSRRNKLECSIDVEAGVHVRDHSEGQWEQFLSPRKCLDQQWVVQENEENHQGC